MPRETFVEDIRYRNARKAHTSMMILDSKTIQNADTPKVKGYDAGKKTGIKLHIGVDTLGLPHILMVTTADITDRDGGLNMLEHYNSFNNYMFSRLLKFLVDGGYTREYFASSVYALTEAVVEVTKRNELHKFKVIPKRWIVERTFGWLDKYRRLWKNCERKLHNTYQMINLAFIRLMLKRY